MNDARTTLTDRQFRTMMFVASVVLSAIAALGAADDTKYSRRYFDGLRERRLFALAESHCLDQLARENLPPAHRMELTLELSRTYSEHAKFAAGGDQDDLWKQAERTVGDLVKDRGNVPRRVMLHARWASIPAERAEFLRWRLELSPFDEHTRRTARDAAHDGIQRLRDLETALSAMDRSTRERDDGELTPYEVRQLLYVTRFRLGLAYLTRIALHPTGSADRSATVIDAEEQFRRLAGDEVDDDISLKSRVYLAECRRLRGDISKAASLLNSLVQDDKPPAIRDLATEYQLRILLDDARADEALQQLDQYERRRQSLPGELHLLRAQALAMTLVATLRSGGDVEAVRQQLKTAVRGCDTQVGGYWSRRCRQLIELADLSIRFGPEVSLLVREAGAAWQQKRIDDALGLYERAIAGARDSSKADVAAELMFTRASILIDEERFAEAVASLRELVSSFPSYERIAQADLLAAYSAGREFARVPSKELRAEYASALESHRERFPDSPTANDATWMLARLEDQSKNVFAALKLYLQIPAGHPNAHEAHAATARCYEQILVLLRRRDGSDSKRAAWEKDATGRLAAILQSYRANSGALDGFQAETVFRTSRVLLNLAEPDYSRADVLLQTIIDADPEQLPPEQADRVADYRNRAMGLRIVSLAGRRQFDAAEQALDHIARGTVAELLAVLDSLAEMSVDADDETRAALGELQLRTTRALDFRRNELDDAQKRTLDVCVARACVATKQFGRAVVLYKSLLDKTPDDRTLLRALAETNELVGSRETLAEAGRTWQRLESLEKPGSRDWLDARFHVANCALLRGEIEACRKLLTVTRLLYPDPGNDELRRRFDELRQRLDAAGSQ